MKKFLILMLSLGTLLSANSLTHGDALSIVNSDCSNLQRKASFQISSKCDFSIKDISEFDSESVITVDSTGFFYNITFQATYNIDWSKDGRHYRYTLISVYKK